MHYATSHFQEEWSHLFYNFVFLVQETYDRSEAYRKSPPDGIAMDGEREVEHLKVDLHKMVLDGWRVRWGTTEYNRNVILRPADNLHGMDREKADRDVRIRLRGLSSAFLGKLAAVCLHVLVQEGVFPSNLVALPNTATQS